MNGPVIINDNRPAVWSPGSMAAACIVAGVTVAVALAAAPGWASPLLAPAVGAADNATMGSHVADPHTPSAALFENPAGLTQFDTFTHGGGLGIGYGRGRIEASVPAGYNQTNTAWPVVPDFGLSIPYRERWRFAVGTYGTTGSRFDFDAEPALGVPAFFSETIMLAIPVGAAYRLNDQVSIGAAVEPLFGQLRTHFTLGGLPFRYKINGPGVQGTVGLTLRPSAQWALGVAARLPGMTWMSGSMPVPGVGRQGIHDDVQMPAQVFLGATWRGLERLAVSGSIRFTNSSSFGDSTIEYELTPQANSGIIPDAKDEWKVALAAEYTAWAQSVLRLGGSWGSHIVGAKGVSPLVFDADDTKIGIGLGQQLGRWGLDAMAGYALPVKRHIPPNVALVLPGAYSMEGALVMVGLTYRN